MGLKIASVEDIDTYLTLGLEAYNQSPVGGLYKPELARNYLQDYLTKPLNEVCPLLVVDPEPVGFLIGSLVHDPFSLTKLAVEHHWYVQPEYRKTRAGLDLLNAFEYWAQKLDCRLVYLSSGTDPRLEKLLSRKGYTKHSSIMIKDI